MGISKLGDNRNTSLCTSIRYCMVITIPIYSVFPTCISCTFALDNRIYCIIIFNIHGLCGVVLMRFTKILSTFVGWLIITFIIYYFLVPKYGEVMFNIFLIAFLVLPFLMYIPNMMKKYIPVAILGIIASSAIYCLSWGLPK